MITWIAVSVAAALIVSLNATLRRRDGLLELGSVSTQWLAEHRDYKDGDRSR